MGFYHYKFNPSHSRNYKICDDIRGTLIDNPHGGSHSIHVRTQNSIRGENGDDTQDNDGDDVCEKSPKNSPPIVGLYILFVN